MAIVILGTGGQFQPLPPGTEPGAGDAGEHKLRITDSAGRTLAGARVTIDSGAVRYADSSGRLRIPPAILRPGTHTLRIAAPAHVAQDVTLVVPQSGVLDLQFRLTATAAPPGPGGSAPAPTAVALTWGQYVPFGSPSPWTEIDPTTPSESTRTSDQPSADTERSINASDYGSVCALLSGVEAGVAVEWSITPALTTSGPKVLFQAAGPVLIAWFTYVGTPHAEGTYSVTATVGAVVYGPIVLTVG